MTPGGGDTASSGGAGVSRALSRSVRRVSVREGYRLWAVSYDSDPNPLLALEERSLELLIPSLQGKTAVDLGCGTGRWLRRLVQRGAQRAFGVDFSREMLNGAARDARLRSRVILGDCTFLPLCPGIADLVVFSFSLTHISDVDGLAREIARISRVGAQVFLSDLHPDAQAIGWRCGFRYQGTTIEISGYQHKRASVWKAFANAGFTMRSSLDCFVGEPERQLFAQGGKKAMFEAARAVPAVAIDHFLMNGDSRPSQSPALETSAGKV